MRFLDGFTVTAILAFAFAPQAQACSATSTVDAARKERDTDHYRNARVVAEEVIDQERFDRDEDSIESATGTLLMAKASQQINSEGPTKGQVNDGAISRYNSGADRDAYRALLNEVGEGHGIRSDGTVALYAEASTTVRDHMRLHLWQWYEFNRGLNPAGGINEFDAGPGVSVVSLPGGSVPASSPAPGPVQPTGPSLPGSSTPSPARPSIPSPPKAASPVEPPAVSPVEPPAVSPVEPPAALEKAPNAGISRAG